MNVYLDSVGCRLNQSELEQFASQLRTAGHVIVDTPAGADLVIVNTCTVTGQAASDSRQKIRQAQRAGAGAIIAAGCWATLEPEAAAGLPGVTRVVPNSRKDDLVRLTLGGAAAEFDLEPLARRPLPGVHLRTRAFIKAQDGCNNRCSYCITTLARGAASSRSEQAVLTDIQAAERGGAQEIVLTGVHLGSWGCDFPRRRKLAELLAAILKETAVPRIRLSSLEPWDLDEEFFSLWQNKRLCRHLHLPLQSGCKITLRRMARATTPEQYQNLAQTARRLIPGLALTTDLIAGFPGETEADFEESLAFVKEMEFAGGHVFPYSERPGTAAADLPDPVPHRERRQRAAHLRAVLAESSRSFRSQFLGKELPVLWEAAGGLGPDGWEVTGLTGNYIKVHSASRLAAWNQVTPVRLISLTSDGMVGEIAAGEDQRASLASSTESR